MIARISGRLIEKSVDGVVVDVGGIGYEAFIPLSTYYRLPDVEAPVSLVVHTCLKDDAIELYAFFTSEERSLFRLLIGVTGVGPKLARNILSGISVDDFLSSVAREDVHALTSVPGLGKKTAERIVLELKDKVSEFAFEAAGDAKAGPTAIKTSPMGEDALSALINLGYKESVARGAVRDALAAIEGSSEEGAGLEDLLKRSLNVLLSR